MALDRALKSLPRRLLSCSCCSHFDTVVSYLQLIVVPESVTVLKGDVYVCS